MINPDSRVAIHPGGYVTVDVLAWLDQRTGGPIDELTTALQGWASRPDAAPWLENAQTWMTTSGFEPTSPELVVTDVIAHIETRLDAEVWILRGVHRECGRVAVVGINHDPPTVYADSCTDSGDWYDADSVDIACPGGYGWTWRSDRELITADGSFVTLTEVFGPSLDAPFKPCPHCRAYIGGFRSKPCGCDGIPWIICPTCGRRCDLHLPTR